MHEMSIAMAMVDQVTGATGPRPHDTVSAVRLRLGELAGVVPDSLHFCFGLACAGTPLDGAELTIDHVPGRARCTPCAAEWATGMPPRLSCPHCAGSAVELLSGREMRITGVEWADPCDDAAGPARATAATPALEER